MTKVIRVHIKYVGGGAQGVGAEGFTIFSKKKFVAQEIIDLNIFSENISWPLPSILVSYLRLTCSSISG